MQPIVSPRGAKTTSEGRSLGRIVVGALTSFVLGMVLVASGLATVAYSLADVKVFASRALRRPEGEMELRFPERRRDLEVRLVVHCDGSCRQESYSAYGRLTALDGHVLLDMTHKVTFPASRTNDHTSTLGAVAVESGEPYTFAWRFSYRGNVERYELQFLERPPSTSLGTPSTALLIGGGALVGVSGILVLIAIVKVVRMPQKSAG